jgi:hypothetical protein
MPLRELQLLYELASPVSPVGFLGGLPESQRLKGIPRSGCTRSR